jgi:hypothetical protein
MDAGGNGARRLENDKIHEFLNSRLTGGMDQSTGPSAAS